MAKYRCKICGHIYDESKEKVKFIDLPDDWKCPLCLAPKNLFEKIEEEQEVKEEKVVDTTSLERDTDELEEYMKDIHYMANKNESIIMAMGTKKSLVSWDDIVILGAQLNPIPLAKDAFVDTKTIIGKKAKKPLVTNSPIFISHMSFGALSKEMKTAMAKASTLSKTAIGSGEGGILEDEIDNAYKYIFEYVPNLYSVNDENLKRADAIEIKIGQGTKPGMGGHLPKEKVTEEIARIRNRKMGEDIISPSHFENVKNKEDLKNLVDELRNRSEGRPIGIKIAAGHIEDDLDVIAFANPDFITIDGRGGATGASPKFVRDATTVPTIYALSRARKYLDKHNLDIDLIITGGLRISSDFAKALAMGADAIAVATSIMISAGCQQYRICGSDKCPMGIATQDPELRKRFDVEKNSKKIANYLNVSLDELRNYARITGNDNIHDLSLSDIRTISRNISKYTDIKHV